jgi:hypothetical protein
MSRHHMLPPLVHVPQPQPKKIENRRRRTRPEDVEDLEMAAEAHEATGAGRSTALANKLPPPAFPAIEGSERKPQNPGGRLSESTLAALLHAQEAK